MLEAVKSVKMTRLRVLLFAVAMGLMAFAASPALAHVGNYWHDVPNYAYADADIKITTFRTPGTSSGYISLNNSSGSSKVYVQARPVFDSYWSNDGYWKKVYERSARTSGTVAWSDRTYLDFDAYEFRICKDVYRGSDSCGSSTSVRP